jgi:hypothetical protein
LSSFGESSSSGDDGNPRRPQQSRSKIQFQGLYRVAEGSDVVEIIHVRHTSRKPSTGEEI